MNLSPGWAEFLGLFGFEADHWSNIGAVDALDEAIMVHAKLSGAIILTSDLDFGGILAATGGNSPSVVQIRSDDLSVQGIGDQVVAALRQTSQFLADGALITVEPARTRLTVLPIGRKGNETS